MRVIGDGLIARACGQQVFGDEVVIIASGVSNSLETRDSEFQREENLIKYILRDSINKKVVYFSSCVLNIGLNSMYAKHKMQMEKLLLCSKSRVYIFRLPQVVGVVNNNTIISYLVRNLYLNNPIEVKMDATRNFIDVEDVARIVRILLENEEGEGRVSSITSLRDISVLDVVNKIKDMLSSKSEIIQVLGGEKYLGNCEWLRDKLPFDDKIFADNYGFNVVEKYVNKIRQTFKEEWTGLDINHNI